MKQEEQFIELDILYLLRTLWRKKLLVLLAALLGTCVAFVYSSFIAKEEYDSTTRIYVVNKVAEGAQNLTTQELQAGTYLVKDYKEIILSQDVLYEVSEELGMKEALAPKVTVQIPVDTRIVSITVRDANPTEAARIANALRAVAARKIIEVTKVSDVTTLEEARVAAKPSTPKTKRNLALGFVAGFVLSVGLLLLREILDDRVKRPEDIEEKMGLPLIGVVPNIGKVK